MAAMSARRLKPVDPVEEEQLARLIVIDPDTGERVGTYGELTQELSDLLATAERNERTWRMRCRELERDRDAEAEESPVWPAAVRVFDYWRERCRHPGSEWTRERFEMIAPHLERSNTGKGKAGKLTPELIGRNEEICKLAVDGIAFDPFVTIGKNGRQVIHDGLHLVFGSTDLLEKRCKMAPLERIREVFGSDKGGSDGTRPDDQPEPGGETAAPGGSQQGSLLEGGGQT